MTNLFYAFWFEDHALDLVEYTLLSAFLCIAAGVLFMSAGASTSGIWAIANQQLSNESLIRLYNTRR
jgi:hypothetical protein